MSIYPETESDHINDTLSDAHAKLSINEEIIRLTLAMDNIPKGTEEFIERLKEELFTTEQLIDKWEKVMPMLMRKRTIFRAMLMMMEGKADYEQVKALSEPPKAPVTGNEVKMRRGGSQPGKKFIKHPDSIITDEVIEHIREFISQTDTYKKSKVIFHYLIDHHILSSEDLPGGERQFAIRLGRVSTDRILYNAHSSVMAWGLPDFGSPDHKRRAALKNGASDSSVRIASYGKGKVA